MQKIYLAFDQQEQQKYKTLLVQHKIDPDMFQDQPNPETEIILGSPNVIAGILPLVPNVKWIQGSWAGVEPLIAAEKKDYVLTNSRGIFGQLISEFVFGYILFFEKNIRIKIETQKQKIWDKQLPNSLKGKTIGLLGVGSIGSELARIAKAFNMKVRGYTFSSQGNVNVDEYFQGNTLQHFMQDLDYLVCIVPNTRKTKNMVNASVLAQLPEKCIVFNVGRGQTIDEVALAEMLNNGKLRAAVLDVFKQEPLPQSDSLWTTKNCYITSHTSGPSLIEDVAGVFLDNYHRYLKNQALRYEVNFEKEY